MLAFAIRRLIQAIGVMLVVAMISFVMFRFVGDPVSQLVGNDTPPEARALLRKELGLDDPIYVQFARFVDKAAHFNFGISYQIKQPVSQLIAQRLPATLELSIVSAILALVIGMPMGVYTGLYPHSWLSRVFLSISRRHIAAYLPDRYSPHLHLLGQFRHAAVLRARRRRLAWRGLDDGATDEDGS